VDGRVGDMFFASKFSVRGGKFKWQFKANSMVRLGHGKRKLKGLRRNAEGPLREVLK